MSRCAHNWVRDVLRGSRYACSNCGAKGYRRKWNKGEILRYRCAHPGGCQEYATKMTWSGCYERWYCEEHLPKAAREAAAKAAQ